MCPDQTSFNGQQEHCYLQELWLGCKLANPIPRIPSLVRGAALLLELLHQNIVINSAQGNIFFAFQNLVAAYENYALIAFLSLHFCLV